MLTRPACALLLLTTPLVARIVSAEPTADSAIGQPAAAPAAEPPAAPDREAPGAAELRAFDLPEAIRYAREHHPRLRALQERVRSALLRRDAVAAQWLPRVGAMAQVVGSTTNNSSTTLLPTSTVALPRIGATEIDGSLNMRPHVSTAVGLGIQQQLFDFGRVEAEAAAQRMLVTIEQLGAQDARLAIEAAIADAYHAVHAARWVLDASRAAEQRSQRHVDMAKAAVSTGLRPPIEFARVQANRARYEVGVLRAEGGLRVARTLFAASCGVPDQELDAAGEPSLLEELPPLEAFLTQQRARDPGLLAARARADAQRAEASALEAQVLPALYANASLSARAGGSNDTNGPLPPGQGFVPTVPNYHVGVVLALPLYDPVNRQRQQAARVLSRALDAEADDLQRARRAQVSALYEEARIAARALSATERAATAAQLNYQYAEQRFAVGLGSGVELSDAEALRIEAEVQLAVAKAQAQQRRAQLARVSAEDLWK